MASEHVRDLQSEVEGVKSIMTQNVERILARGENLDHLRNKTEDLEATVSPEVSGGLGATVAPQLPASTEAPGPTLGAVASFSHSPAGGAAGQGTCTHIL